MVEISVSRRHLVFLLIAAVVLVVAIPLAVSAATQRFVDVPPTDWAYDDVEWLAANGLTNGCGDGTTFCPDDGVTRREMAAFTHRLATSHVVEAKTSMDADLLDGKDSTAFLGKADYDTDGDGIVDSAEIKIRHAHEGFYVDIAGATADRLQCATAPLTFEGMSTVVASGGLSLSPLNNDNAAIYGRVIFSPEGDPVWYVVEGEDVVDSPSGGTGAAAVPINMAHSLGAGTYEFAIYPYGSNIQIGNPDYYGLCELTVTAYTGQGASTDFTSMPTDLTTASVQADE